MSGRHLMSFAADMRSSVTKGTLSLPAMQFQYVGAGRFTQRKNLLIKTSIDSSIRFEAFSCHYSAFSRFTFCLKISFFYDFKKNIYTVPSLVLVVVLFCQKNKTMKIKKIEVKNFVLTYDGMFSLEFNFIFIY